MNLTKKEATLTQQEYRNMKGAINASSIKLYIKDRPKFIKEVVMGEPADRSDTMDTIMGSMVHCKILEPVEKFDEQYVITQVTPPSGQMYELITEMQKIDKRTRDSEGKQSVQFEEIFMAAVQEVKYAGGIEEVKFKKKTPEKILQMFTEHDKDTGVSPEQYYTELLKNHGKTVVTMFQIEKCEKIVQEMKENPWISKWINAVDTDEQHVYNEYAIQFQYKDMKTKALLDRFIVNHKDKVIEPCDIKSTWDSDGVSYTYVKNYWYIQAAMYDLAIKHFIAEHNLDGYQVLPLRWLICDTRGNNRSHSYRTTEKDLQKAYEGFTTKSGRKYPGLLPIMDEILWSSEHGIWNTSKEIVDAQGELLLEVPYE